MIAFDYWKARKQLTDEMLEAHQELHPAEVGRIMVLGEKVIDRIAKDSGVSESSRFGALKDYVQDECAERAEKRRREAAAPPTTWLNPEPSPPPWWRIQLPSLFRDAFVERRSLMRRRAGIEADMTREQAVAWIQECNRTQVQSGDSLLLYFPTLEGYEWDGRWSVFHAGQGPTDVVRAFSGDGPDEQPLHTVARTVEWMMRALDCNPIVAWRYLIEGGIEPVSHMRVEIHAIPEPKITLTVRSPLVSAEEVAKQYAAAVEVVRHGSRLKSYRDDTVSMYEYVSEQRAQGRPWKAIASDLEREEAGLRNQYGRMRREIEGGEQA